MHLRDGEIKAYLDHETAALEGERIQAHLAGCPACQQRQERLREISAQVAGRMHSLAQPEQAARLTTKSAQARFEQFGITKEKAHMKNRWVVRYRPALIAAGLVLLIGISMAFAPVRAIANSFLGLFRVQQVEVVQVNPGDLPQRLGSSYQLEYFMSNDVQFEQGGEDQVVGSAEEASALAGIPVRLPPGMNGEQRLVVTAPLQITFTVELALMQALLEEIGRGDISLPPEIDGAVVTVDLPGMVSAQYGDCQVEDLPEGYDPDDPSSAGLSNCTVLIQMPNPQVSAPEGLNLTQLGEAYLQLLGMSAEEAEHFSRNIDWASTLVIPIPAYEALYQQVEIDGVPGTLILRDDGGDQQYMLIWIKNEIVYVLSGPGSANTALRLANSIR